MIHWIVRTILCACVAIGSIFAHAAENQKGATIGQVLFSTPSNARPWDEAFRGGLHDLGYVEGKNITIVVRLQTGIALNFPRC